MQTDLEKQHVQQVYETIASHFSETRYKPWPLVEKHIIGLEPASIVADVGCGNGKYLGCNPNVYALGSDQSTNLIKICKERGFECLVADGLHLPFRDMSCDHAICIAVVHHFSTRENRIAALKELQRIVRIGGTVLVTVWAFEQAKNKYTEQDVMIKWHLQKRFDGTKQQQPKKARKNKKNKESNNQAESTKEDVSSTSGQQQTDNQHVVAEPSSSSSIPSEDTNSSNEHQVLERYYHLFKKGELDELAIAAGGFEILESVWDVDNWYVVLKRLS